MTWGYRIGIQGKFAVSLFIVGLLPGIVALFFTYAFTKKTIHHAIGTNFQELAREAAREVDAFLQREVEDAWNISVAPPVVEAVSQGRPLASAAAYLKTVERRRETEYERITLYDRFDKPLMSTAPTAERVRPSRTLKTGSNFTISDLYRKEGVSDDLLDISVPVLDERARKQGTVTLTVRFEEVYESILGVKIGKTGHAMLVSSEGTPLICPILPPQKHLLNPPLMTMISQ
ncbi:MAG: cache domain-containing protein, partial [Nitrospirae bacterium]|nr:cache domain-containing protein [Nitrospirota bacterium]